MTRYVYDGRRVIQERYGNNVPTVSYTRGNDLSGSFEGAGGIGGLLARSSGYSGGSWTSHACYYADGNGNVVNLTDANQNVVATYRYDPFGKTTYSSGTLAGANIYRFSSKEWIYDGSSGYYYYGFRFYDPNLQRWPNRDPLGERYDLNLYRCVYNSPPNYIDPDGRFGLPGAIIGGVVGGISGGISGIVGGALEGGWEGALAGGVSGFLGGAGAGAITGAVISNPLAAGAVGGAAEDYLGQFVGHFLSNDPCKGKFKPNWGSVAAGAVGGAIGGQVGSLAARGLPSLDFHGQPFA